jgi:hypothetical protein
MSWIEVPRLILDNWFSSIFNSWVASASPLRNFSIVSKCFIIKSKSTSFPKRAPKASAKALAFLTCLSVAIPQSKESLKLDKLLKMSSLSL